MASDQHLQLGKKNPINFNIGQVKSGITSAEFKDNEVLTSIFNSCDENGNNILDENEVDVFKDKLTKAAGEDLILDESEAKKLLKQEQAALREKQKAKSQSETKTKAKADDLYNFANQWQNWSKNTKVKSSVVDRDKRIVTYEDGGQEVINKDGSKILTSISDGKKFTRTLDKDGKPLSEEMVNDETGDIETILYGDDGKIKEHTIKNGNNTTILGTEDNFANGKPVKQILNQGTTEQETIEYNYSGENSYTSTKTKGDIKNVTVVENGVTKSSVATQYNNGKKVQSMSMDSDGTVKRSLYYDDDHVKYTSVVNSDGLKTETLYKEDGKKLQSVMTNAEGKVQVANYDGQGNTLVVVQNGETFDEICKDFRQTKKALIQSNKGTVHFQKNGEPYFEAGDTAKVSGEYSPDFRGLQNRLSSSQVKGQYARDEQKRVAKRLQGKEIKEVTVGKDYTDWSHYAKDMLKSEGVSNPTNKQVVDRTNELMMMNSSVRVLKKGVKITALKTDAEIKAEKEAEAQRQAEAQGSQKQQNTSKGVKKVDVKLQKEAKQIADGLYTELRKKEFSTVDKNENFNNQINKINSLNVVEVYKAYDKASPDESLAEAISWEVTSSNKAIRTAEGKIFNALYARAGRVGLNKQHIENYRQQASLALANNDATQLDRVMSGLVQAIDNRENLGVNANEIQSRSASENRSKTVNTLKEIYNEAKSSLQNHKDSQGWAGSVVGALRNSYGAPRSPEKIDAYMKTQGDLIKGLENSVKSNTGNILDNLPGGKADASFKSAFKSAYGVEYDPVAIEAYSQKRNQFKEASSKYAIESKFNNDLAKLVSGDGKLKPEYKTVTLPNGTTSTTEIASKSDVYNKELNKFASFLGMGDSKVGMQQINAEMKKAGINPKTASVDVKYKFLSDRAKNCSKLLHNQTMSVTGGKSFREIQKEYKNSYTGAFGTKNNIQQKIEDYTTSIEASAGVLKSGIKIVGGVVIGVATGGTGVVPLLAAAGLQSGLTFAVDASDLATSKRGGTAQQYLDLANDAIVDGASQVLSGGVSKYIDSTSLSTVSKVLLNTASDTAIDMGVEFVNTGDVTLQSTLISAFASGTSNTIGAFMEHRANKEIEKAFEIDEDALRREYGSVDSGWLGGAKGTEAINPQHSRYNYHVSSAEMGGGTRAKVQGVEVELDAPRGISVDVSAEQRRAIQKDVASLGVKGEEFNRGLETLEAIQVAKTSYTPRADGVIDYKATEGLGKRGSGVANRSAVTAPGREDWRAGAGMSEEVYQNLSKKGVIGDSQLLEDCGNLAGKAYGGDKPYKGWNIATDADGKSLTTDLDNGFHAKAYQKDGKVVIAFRGSDDVGDLTSDFAMMAGRTPEQLDNAVAFVERVKQQFPDAQIVVTGHSLGGSLTEMVSSKFDDVVGFTFDAVGTKNIVEATGGALKDNHNTVNYIVHGDVLSNADAHVGQTVVVSNISKGNELLSPHAIGNFMGNSSALEGVESGILARHVAANTDPNAIRLSNLIQQSTDGTVTVDSKQFRGIAERFEYDVTTLGADLDALENQIKSLSDPSQRAQLQSIVDSRRVSITRDTNISANTNTIRTLSGDEVNDVLARDFGFTEPGFLGGDTPSAEIVTRKPTKFVRVFNDQSSFAKGTWLMPYDEIVGKTPEQIKDFYALPAMPKYIVEVEVPAGTKMFTGKCNPLEGWGNGGGTQYFVTDNFEIPTNFDKKRLIKGATN